MQFLVNKVFVMKNPRFLLSIATVCTLSACGGGGNENGSAPVAISPPVPNVSTPAPSAPPSGSNASTPVSNIAPVANAGGVQNLLVGAVVTLDGSASSDANGDTLTYSWVLTSKPVGSNSALVLPASPKSTFLADVAGTYSASLVVSDGKLSSEVATTTINVAIDNAAPTANAGQDQSVVTGTTVILDGSASNDTNGDPLTYAWTISSKPAGSNSALNFPTSPKPTFFADVSGTYVISLTVNDGKLSSLPATLTVNSTAANATPIANAGSAQDVIVGKSVTLDGTASSDANGDSLTYTWSLASKPVNSNATISNPTASKPSFSADIAGVFVASLIVNDGKVSSQPATVTVTAAVGNTAPVANAGAAQSAYIGDLINLDGSASKDADGDTLTYVWSTKSYPGLFAPTLSGSVSPKPSFRASDYGTYVFSLVVNDGHGVSTPSTVTVTVADGVGPTPAGTGLVVQKGTNLWTLDEKTLNKQVDFSCGRNFDAIDRRPDGVIVGMTTNQFFEINPAGACSARGSTPEWLTSLAVSPQGQVFGVSFSQIAGASGTMGHRLYKLSNSGASQSYVVISGASTYVRSIDFSPDGQLYGLGITSGGKWSVLRINSDTGVNAIAFTLPVAPTLGDIDIDQNGVLRTVINGSLYKFDIATGTLLSTAPIPDFPAANATAPIVYIP